MADLSSLSLPDWSSSPEDKSNAAGHGVRPDPEAGAGVRLSQEELAALLAFFELLQEWDQDQKTV